MNSMDNHMDNHMALLTMALLSNTLGSPPCTSHNLLLCLRRTTILTMPHKHTNLSSHSMVRSNHRSSFKLPNLLLMVTVCPLINLLMGDLHSSGLVLPSKHVPLLTITVVEVALVTAVEVMKHLSWVLLFVWVLIMSAEVVIWLKRAMAFLINMQIISLHLLLSPNHLIKAIRLKISEDSVHHLILIHTTLALTGAEEETRTFEEEIVVISNNSRVAVVVIITIVIKTMVTELLQRITISLQVQMPMAKKRRSVAPQILSVSHQMVLIMKIVKMKLMM